MIHQKSFALSLVGLILSIILTYVAFHVVEAHTFSTNALYVTVVACGVLQLLVQIFCFLRLKGPKEDQRWNWVALLFTLIVTVIVVGGSLWIMYNLNYNMMH
jgi:cytochrome o ubiquinol oxidase operon protein cyoD